MANKSPAFPLTRGGLHGRDEGRLHSGNHWLVPNPPPSLPKTRQTAVVSHTSNPQKAWSLVSWGFDMPQQHSDFLPSNIQGGTTVLGCVTLNGS